MKSTTILLLVLHLSWLSESKLHRHHGKSYIFYEEKELHRTKRHIDLESKRNSPRIEVSPIKHTERNKRSLYRPYVPGQVQDVRIQIKLKTYWKDQLANRYTPQARLLAGNVIDEVSNALIDNRNFVEAVVLKFSPSKWNILVDLSLKFFKTEVDPLHYLEGIVASGWVSGLQVFNNYFKVIKILNGNANFPVWNYPKGLRLRLHPAILTKVHPKKPKKKVILPANYKEIRISYQLYQKWNQFFLIKFSAPYRLLSGNIEESLDHAFVNSPNYLDSQVIGFRESHEGQCIVDMIVRFSSEEVYPAQKLKILVSSGNIGDIPVISDSLEIYEINNITSDQPIQEPSSQEEFSKPHSGADVNQGNETEPKKEQDKSSNNKNLSGQQQETKKPSYPLPNSQSNSMAGSGFNGMSAVPSEEASMYLKLERLRLSKQQSGAVTMSKYLKKLPKSPTNNIVEETFEPIYPKQSKIDGNGAVISEQQQQQKEFEPQKQQEKPTYQLTQQQKLPLYQQVALQQENKPQYLQQQQQPSPYKQKVTLQQQQQPQEQIPYSQQQQAYQNTQQQYGSLSKDGTEHDRELWQSLPEQVEGKLVMNSQKPALQAAQQEAPKGYEKQLAQPPPANKPASEYEKLKKLLRMENNENRVTNNVETGSQGQEDGLAYGSDTPTLTKTLYPQIAYSNNQSNGNEAYNTTEAANKNSPKSPNSILQVAENVLAENQKNEANSTASISNGKPTGIRIDNNGVTTLIAGVLQEQVKHIKAVQLHTTYKIPVTSNTSANTVEHGDSSGEKWKQDHGEVGIEGPQLTANVHTQEQGNVSRPQNTTYVSNGNSLSAQEISMGRLPNRVYSGEKVENATNANKTFFTVASQKAKPLNGIGAAYWNFSVPQPTEPNPESNSSKVEQQSVKPNESSYWGAQPITQPQQANTQLQQQHQPSTNQQQQEQQSITYPQQTQQQPMVQQYSKPNTYAYQQPNTYQQPQQQKQAAQQYSQQNPYANQQPNTYQQPQQQKQTAQQYSQQNPYAYQQPNTYQQPQQQKQTAQQYSPQNPYAYQQPNTYQQPQQQQTQKPPIYQQQQQTSQQPITDQQQKQVGAISNEAKTPQTLAPVYSTSSATGYQSKQEQQFTASSSSSKTEAVSSSVPFSTKAQNDSSTSKEQNTPPPNSSYILQTNPPPLTNPAVTYTVANQAGSQNAVNQSKTTAMDYYNRKEPVPNGTEATSYNTATQGPPQNYSMQKMDGSQPSPHVYTPKVINYQWPPEATPLESPPSQNHPAQNNTLQQVITSEKEASSLIIYHSLHAAMTLQQTWHPLLSSTGSFPFKVLAQHIEHSVEETYLAHHMSVRCKVKGLRKSHRNASNDVTPDKVGVDFDLTFQSNEVEVIQTLKQVVKNGVIAELLVFPDSVSIENASAPNTLAPSNPLQQNQTTSSSSDQTLVATSPIPLGNTAEAKPDNNTAAMNYSGTFPPTSSPLKTSKAPTQSFEFVTAPKDMPKSCEEIRDFGVGRSDGQYVLEARKGCHLSVICQNMEDIHPKEFLGGPNRQQWEAYPFAALIKISAHDKENIQSGACLENSDEGRKLLEEIFKAKGKQRAPTPPWQTNIKKLLEGRKRREIRNKLTVILEGDADEDSSRRFSRSSNSDEADWGVL